MANIQFRLAYRAIAQGNSDDYEVELLVCGEVMANIHFTHDYDYDDDDREVAAVNMKFWCYADKLGFRATETRVMMAMLNELHDRCDPTDNVIEDLFDGVGSVIDWPNAPTWLFKDETVLEQSMAK